MQYRLLLTGTPLQNNVMELFSLLNFLDPVKFDSSRNFESEYGVLESEEQVAKLQKLIMPHLLRRVKVRAAGFVSASICSPGTRPGGRGVGPAREASPTFSTPPPTVSLQEDVEKSIPKKEETIIDVELTLLQKQYYRAILERNRLFLYRGCERTNLPGLLNLEMQLRKVCNHPYLIVGVEAKEGAGLSDAERVEKMVRCR